MNCDDFQKSLGRYYHQDVPQDERAKAHEQACPQCAGLSRTAAELSCREFVKFLGEYIEKTMPAEQSQVFERHLTICSDCVNYLNSYRKTMAMSVSAMSTESLFPGPVPEDLIQAILHSRKIEERERK